MTVTSRHQNFDFGCGDMVETNPVNIGHEQRVIIWYLKGRDLAHMLIRSGVTATARSQTDE